MVARANGTRRRSLGRGQSPEWSVDGRRLFYVAPSVFVLGRDGTVRFIDLATRERGELPFAGTTEFSPDGKFPLGQTRLVPTDGGPATPLQLRWPYDRTAVRGPARYSPDGRIAYPCNPPARVKGFRSSYGDLSVGDPRTQRYRRLGATRHFHEMEGVQSPSKRWYAVTGMHGLYVMRAKGGKRRMLVRNPGLLPPTSNIPHSPDWRPRQR